MSAPRPRKRLLVVNHATTLGGASLSLEHILKSIDTSVFDISIYCRSDRPDFALHLESLGFDVIFGGSGPTPFAHFSGAEFPAVSLSAFANVARILRDCMNISRVLSKRYDLVIVNSMTLFWVGRLARRHGSRTAMFHRETFIRGRFGLRTRLIKHEILHGFDGVAYISEYERIAAGDFRASSSVISDKVDPSAYADIDRRQARRALGIPDGYYVLYLGGASRLKGPDTILRALELIDQKASLIFLGAESAQDMSREGSDRGSRLRFNADEYGMLLRRLAKSEKLQERVLFRAASADVNLYYLASDLVVFPSSRPHQARPIYEAGVAQRLLVLSDFPNTKEFARDGVNCVEFPPGDAAALARRVNDAVRHPGRVHELIRENRRLTLLNHNIANLRGEVEHFLRGVL